jgi:hypothetical protein
LICNYLFQSLEGFAVNCRSGGGFNDLSEDSGFNP